MMDKGGDQVLPDREPGRPLNTADRQRIRELQRLIDRVRPPGIAARLGRWIRFRFGKRQPPRAGGKM